MSFEEIWQENKSFLLTVGAGLVVFFAAYLIVTGQFDSDIGRMERLARTAKARAARDSRELPRGVLSETEGALETANQELERLEGEMAYRPRPGFTLKGATKSPDIHFNEIVEAMSAGLVDAALRLDIRIQPDLGLDGRTPANDAEREWYLNGLDVVNRIAIAGIESQVRSIEPVVIAAPKKRRRGRRATTERPYIRELRVKFTATGHPASINGLMRGLSVASSRLSVDSATLTSLDDPEGKKKNKGGRTGEQLVRLEMTVSALLIDREGEPARPKSTRI